MRYKTITHPDGSTTVTDEWCGHRRLHYMLEHERHKEFYAHIYADNKKAEVILRKLKRHFKLHFVWGFTKRRGGVAWHHRINLQTKNNSLGLICHEVAHILSAKKWGSGVHHSRKFQTQCNRVCNWAKRYLPKQS